MADGRVAHFDIELKDGVETATLVSVDDAEKTAPVKSAKDVQTGEDKK